MQNDVNKIVPSCFIKWQDRTGTYRCYVTIAFWRHLNNFVEKNPQKMLFITDKAVSMNEWKETHRADVEKVYALKCSNEDVEIMSQSMEANQTNIETAKQQNVRRVPPQVKGPRIRRHSSYEPNLDDILEDEEDEGKGSGRNRDLAKIHRERARNSGLLKHDRDGRTWRRRHFMNNNYSRPRSYTA